MVLGAPSHGSQRAEAACARGSDAAVVETCGGDGREWNGEVEIPVFNARLVFPVGQGGSCTFATCDGAGCNHGVGL